MPPTDDAPTTVTAEQRAQLRKDLEDRDGQVISADDAAIVREVLGEASVSGGGSGPFRLALGTGRRVDLTGLVSNAFGPGALAGASNPADPPSADDGADKPDARAAATISKFTDIRNSELFVARQKGEISWISDSQTWMEWTDPVWMEVEHGAILRRAVSVGRSIHEAAVASGGRADAVQSARAEGLPALEAMVKLAKSHDDVETHQEEWDAKPLMLNTLSGMITLKSLSMRPSKKEDRLTTMLPVRVNWDAECPIWEAFLDTVLGGDSEFKAYMQHLAGLCLLGETSGEHLFFLYGDGANGKSIFINTIVDLLGPKLAANLPASALALRRSNTDEYALAVLPGKRLAVTSEVSEGAKLDESLIKNMTGGGDGLTVRPIRKEPITFNPTATVVMVGNHKPVITSTDTGIWRRVQMVPFRVTIPEEQRDRHLLEKLRAEREGILRWALEGASAYARASKMPPCAVVQRETQSFRTESDLLQQFVDECCDVRTDASVASAILFDAYVGWCQRSNERALTKTKFGIAMKRLGFEAKATGKARLRLGLDLTSEAAQEFARPLF